MRSLLLIFAFLLALLHISAYGAKIGEDTLIIAEPGSTSPKVLKLGSTRSIRSNESTNKLEYTNTGASWIELGLSSTNFSDDDFFVFDAASPTHNLKFDASTLTATRTFTLPDVSDQVATLTATQILTNKDFDGGVASDNRRITLPQAAKTTLDGLTRKEGTLVYASDTDKMYIDDGASLIELTSGSPLTEFTSADFSIYQSATPSYKAKFDVSALTGTKTFKLPNSNNYYLVDTNSTQDLYNKSMYNMIYNGGSLSNNQLRLPGGTNASIVSAVTDYGELAYSTTDGIIYYYSSPLGSTVQLINASSSQTLTNKDFDGGTASNTDRITLPKNTKTNLDSLTRKEGTLVYATDDAKVYFDNGSSLVEVGTGTATTSFSDASFEIYHDATPSYKLTFDASTVTATRSYSMRDRDGTVALLEDKNEFTIANNQSSAADVTTIVDFTTTSYKGAVIFFDINRKDDTMELVEQGYLYFSKAEDGGTWYMSFDSKFSDSGVTFSIVGGQLKYTSTNMLGGNYSGKMRTSVVRYLEL